MTSESFGQRFEPELSRDIAPHLVERYIERKESFVIMLKA